VGALAHLPLAPQGTAIESLQRVCSTIATVGEMLPVIKRGETITSDLHDECQLSLQRHTILQRGDI
jgi:hypothetical protein